MQEFSLPAPPFQSFHNLDFVSCHSYNTGQKTHAIVLPLLPPGQPSCFLCSAEGWQNTISIFYYTIFSQSDHKEEIHNIITSSIIIFIYFNYYYYYNYYFCYYYHLPDRKTLTTRKNLFVLGSYIFIFLYSFTLR